MNGHLKTIFVVLISCFPVTQMAIAESMSGKNDVVTSPVLQNNT
jgi:hypothetical protein